MKKFTDEYQESKVNAEKLAADKAAKEKEEKMMKDQVAAKRKQQHDDAVLAQQYAQEERYFPNQVGANIKVNPSAPEVGIDESDMNNGDPLPIAAPKPTTDVPLSESKSFMRKVFLPGDLNKIFLQLSGINNARGIETCGVLGAPANSGGNLNVTHLILPPQHGTPDSCNTDDEEKLFEATERFNLEIIGWIHVSCNEMENFLIYFI